MNKKAYEFGNFGEVPEEAAGYELQGAELTIYPIKKARFQEILWENDVPKDQAQVIWDYYAQQTDLAYETARINQGQFQPKPLTRETLAELQLDASGWNEFATANDIDTELAYSLFEAYQGEVAEVVEQSVKAQEAEQQEAQAETAENEQGEVSDDALDQIINDIRKDPAYMGEGGTIAEHDRAVFAMNKAMEMKAGLIPRTWQALAQYVQEYKGEQEQILKDQYGVSSLKPGAYDSSNEVQRVSHDKNGAVDTPTKDADRKSASGGRIEDGGGE